MNLDLARQLVAQLGVTVSQLDLALKANVVVKPGDNLQAAINASADGDVIEVSPGTYVIGAPLTFPVRNVPVTLLGFSSNSGRVTATETLPVISSGIPDKTLDLTNAKNWVFKNLEFGGRADGLGEVVVCQDSDNIVFNRIRIVGGTNGQKRGIRGNGTNIVLSDSYIANCWRSGQDSQAFCAWDGAGPYTITNNYLEAASENVMFGGADSLSADRVPSNILIENNLFTKRIEWKPVPPATSSGKACKNLLEFKSAKHVVVRNNIFENNWTDAQNGYTVLFKSVNQSGTAPWSATEDVLFENNIIRMAANGFNIQGETFEVNSDGSTQHGGRTTDIVIRNNTVQVDGVAVQVSGAPGNLTLERNTFVNGYTFMQLSGNPMGSLTVSGVLANHNDYGVKGDGTGIGTPSLIKFATVYAWTNNVLLGGAGKGSYPATTWYDLASVPAGVLVGK